MKATVTIKDLSDQFWNGFGELVPAFLSQSPIDQFQRLERLSYEMPKNVSLKIGNGSFKSGIWENGVFHRNAKFKSGMFNNGKMLGEDLTSKNK